MKNTRLLLFLILFLFSTKILSAQDITGRWYAKTMIKEEAFHHLLDIRKQGKDYFGYLDLPAENRFRIRLDSLSVSADKVLFCSHQALNFQFSGAMNEVGALSGTLHRNGWTGPMILSKTPQVERSQMIKQPTPYTSKDIHFYNEDSTRLAGTITFPEGRDSLTAVVLVSGSGPQDRNSEILGHQPFSVLADYLSRKGILVLRYDDRGYAQSQGQFRPATSLDYAKDALAAVKFLKNYDGLPIRKIGIAGHSEGGNIAPVVATMDAAVKFLVLLAAPGTSNLDSYLVALDLILKEQPATYKRDYPFFKAVYEDMASIKDKEKLKERLQVKFEGMANQMDAAELAIYGGKAEYIQRQVAVHSSSWYHYYLQFDVTPYLEKLKIPILALNGDQDVSVEAKFNLQGIQKTLSTAGNTNFETVELKDVNHFFQRSLDDKIESVYFNEESFAKIALEKIASWIKQLE